MLQWIQQHYEWVIAIVVAIVGLIVAWLQLKKTPSPQEKTGYENSTNAVVVQNASPRIEQKVIIGPELLRKRPPVPKEDTSRPKPNLTFKGVKVVHVREGIDSGFWDSDNVKDPYAVIACFRNESSMTKEVAPAYDVRCAIMFHDSQRNEIGNGISEALWVNSPGRAHFDVEVSHCAILAIVADDRIVSFCKREVRAHWGSGFVIDAYPLSKDLSTVEFRILRESELLFKPLVLDFSLRDGRPEVKLREES